MTTPEVLPPLERREELVRERVRERDDIDILDRDDDVEAPKSRLAKRPASEGVSFKPEDLVMPFAIFKTCIGFMFNVGRPTSYFARETACF